ncbi:MAG: GDSL-type esterase/lipase family protein [Deltaproteobacteria bacterium]
MKSAKILKTLLAILIILVVLFAICEGLIRVYLHYNTVYDIEMTRYAMNVKEDSENPKIGHVHKPGSEIELMGVNVSINSDGLRDREYLKERRDAYRIIFLGDSLTFGWGVEQEGTFQYVLEEEIGRAAPTEIINFGTGNYNTEQEVNLFFEKGVEYNPDKVVLFYFINDAEATSEKSGLWFLGHSHLISFYWSRINSLMNNIFASKSFKDYYTALYMDDQEGWINSKKAMIELRDYCLENGIAFQVVLLPELHDTDNLIFREVYDKVSLFLQQSGIEYMSLAKLFSDYGDQMELWVSYDDAHPNKLAHGIIAESLVEFISKKETN